MTANLLPYKTVTNIFRDPKSDIWCYRKVVWAADGLNKLERVERKGLTAATVQRMRRYHLAATNGQSWSGAVVKMAGN